MGNRNRVKKYLNNSQTTGRPTKFATSVIVDIYSTGVTAAEVARLLGMHHSTVLYTLNGVGIDTAPKTRNACTMGMLDKRIEALIRAANAVNDHLDIILSEVKDACGRRDAITDAKERAAAKLIELGIVKDEEYAAKKAERSERKIQELQQRRDADSSRNERMMELACPKRRRFAA